MNTKFTQSKRLENACLVKLWPGKKNTHTHTGQRRLPRDLTMMSLPALLGVLEKASNTSKSYMVNKQLNLVNDVAHWEPK